MGRAGIRIPEQGVRLAELAEELPSVEFLGVMSHQTVEGWADRETRFTEGRRYIEQCLAVKRAIEADGVEVVETDLGEFLVQAAGERPSHIIAPALHMTRERAARLIGQVTGEKLAPDPDVLVGAARQYLRDRFIQAGAGIVADSVPEKEYQETVNKAKALINAAS